MPWRAPSVDSIAHSKHKFLRHGKDDISAHPIEVAAFKSYKIAGLSPKRPFFSV
jgi:hypothetical protein